MTAVSDPLLQYQLHEFFGGWGHILEALSEGNNGEAHAFQVLNHLDSTPTVKGNLTDIEAFTQPFNEFLNVAIMEDITLGSLKESLPLPQIVWHMISADTQIQIVFRNPEVWQDHIFIIFVGGREHQYQSCDIRGGGKVKTTVADTALQIIFVYCKFAFVPQVHRHPTDRLFDPLV